MKGLRTIIFPIIFRDSARMYRGRRMRSFAGLWGKTKGILFN